MLLLAVFVRFVAAGPTPPVIDLNGDAPGIDFTATFTEDEGPEPIVSSAGLSISNGDDEVMTGARAALTADPDLALESLSADPGDTALNVKWYADSNELIIKGTAPITDYLKVLRTLVYNNLSQSPDIADRTIVVTVSDGPQVSLPATATVAINAVNDAPVLDNSGDMSLMSINEDDVTSNGNSVTRIIESAQLEGQDRITDVDDGAVEGFAVIEASSGNGEWQYSLNAGASWQPFGAVSNTAAVLLNGAARIRFVPKSEFSGAASFTFRAWDQTSGENGDVGIDVSLNGGATAFSSASEMVIISVLAVNDAPRVDLNGPEDGTDFAAQFFENGPPVAIADSDAVISDVDNATLVSLTATLTNRPDGDAGLLAAVTEGTNITAEPYDPLSGKLVLTGPDTVANFQKVLRQILYQNTSGNPTPVSRNIEVVASDGAAASNVARSIITVNPVNNAPVLNVSTPLLVEEIAEDTPQPPGKSIAVVLAAAGDPITDEDLDALEGVALVAADTSKGVWQYSLAAPVAEASWQPVGVVSPTAALLLSDLAWLRFVPAPNYFGPSGDLIFRAWDQSAGASGQRANASVNGGGTAFSTATGTMFATVTPVNDPPVLGNMPSDPLLYVEDSGMLKLLPAVTVSDVDSPQLASARVRVTNPLDGDAEWLLATTDGTGITADFADGVLTLVGAASPATYQQVLRTVVYWNASQDPDPADRLVEVVVAGTLVASLPYPLTIEVQPVNDPPFLDLDGAGPGYDYEAVFYINRGPVPIVATSLTLNDVDTTTLKGAAIRLTNLKNPQAEALSADVSSAANIKRSYDPATGVLTLTGVDSAANYERVLRTVTYNNVLPQPNTDERVIEFTVSDGTATSVARQSRVRLVAAPTVYQFMPLIAWAARQNEEPNDSCAEALGISLNRQESFLPDDKDDWFFFDLPAAGTVTVELREFAPRRGQLIVASGQGCSGLQLVGSNGENRPDKTVSLGLRPPGRFFIWVINDGPMGSTPYRLLVRTTP